MSRLSLDEQLSQVKYSFNYLESIIGSSSHKTFCFPYGGFYSFSDETEKILSEQGCLYSFNVEHRDIESEDLLTRPQALPRYDCNHFPFGQVRITI